MSASPITLVAGQDPVLRGDVVARLVDELLGADDRTFALDDIGIGTRKADDDERAGSDEGDGDRVGADLSVIERILVALASPPFLTERRVVVIRNIAGLAAAQLGLVIERIADPTPGVYLVLEHEGGRLPAALDKALKAVKANRLVPEAEQLAAESKKNKKGSDQVSVVEIELGRALIERGVKLESAARQRIIQHLGDDGARVGEMVALFASRFPLGSTVRVADVEPYLGEKGAIDSPFALTTAIEQGDTATAIEVLHRLMHASNAKKQEPMHAIPILGMITSYYRALLRIDDPAIVTKDDAAAVLGGNPWAAKYRLDALRKIGSDGLRRAYGLIADADLDLRAGRSEYAFDNDTVMSVLVARLCAIHQRGPSARTPAASGRGR